MVKSEKKSKRSSAQHKPNEKYCKEQYGILSRQQLSEIFTDYIDAYKYTTSRSGFITPTIMFVFMSKKKDDTNPVAVPYHIADYSDEDIYKIVSIAHALYPTAMYTLELIIYAQIKLEDIGSNNHKVMFCARDLGGATIHTLYDFKKLDKSTSQITYNTINKNNKSFNTWSNSTEKTTIKNPYLETVTLAYALATTVGTAKGIKFGASKKKV